MIEIVEVQQSSKVREKFNLRLYEWGLWTYEVGINNWYTYLYIIASKYYENRTI